MCQFHARGCISEDIYKNLQLLFNTIVLIILSIHLSIYLVKQLAFNINCASDTGLVPENKDFAFQRVHSIVDVRIS